MPPEASLSPSGSCRIAGCPHPHRAKGLCAAHYMRLRRHGDPYADVPLARPSLVASRSAARR